MDAIRQWGISICAASLAGAAVHMLLPKGSMEKVVKIMLSVFFITVLVLPFTGSNKITFEFDWETFETGGEAASGLSDMVEQQQLSAAKLELKQTVRDYLKIKEVDGADISINMDIDEADSIVITEMRIVLPREYESKLLDIKFSLKNELGLDAEVKLQDE